MRIAHDAPLLVAHRQVPVGTRGEPGKPGRTRRPFFDREPHPEVAELAMIVHRQGFVPLGESRESPELDQHLKPVADADDEPSLPHKFLKHRHHAVADLLGQEFPAAKLVAEREPAGKSEHRVLGQEGGVLQEPVHVDHIRPSSGTDEGCSRLALTVDSVTGKHQYPSLHRSTHSTLR